MVINNAPHLVAIKRMALLPLFLPWLLSSIVSYNPIASYFCAWLGSFWIFYYSIIKVMKPLSPGLPIQFQVMRPLVLIQTIFAGLMSVSAVFFFLDHLGYYFWFQTPQSELRVNALTYQLAYCQRLYVFAHAALVLGMIIGLKPHNGAAYRWSADIQTIPTLGILVFTSYGVSFFPALSQFAVLLLPVARSLAAIMVLNGLRQGRLQMLLAGAGFLLFTLYQAAHSGFKEGIFVTLILLAFVLYPHYKRIVISLSVPCLMLLFYLLPTWNNSIRAASWQDEVPVEQAAEQAYAQLIAEDDGMLKQNSWEFLTNRFSEIGMFSKYVAHVPEVRPYYGTEILQNAMLALIPRAIWPGKPNTEAASMLRVYEAGVISEHSDASAKTRTVVDGYLSAGYPGVLFTMLCYGLVCQSLCNLAERLFGGYELGCIIIFNGMFQQLWRGNNLEFIINNVVYGLILMLMTFFVLKHSGILIPSEVKKHKHL
jgi:hypothetical protein